MKVCYDDDDAYPVYFATESAWATEIDVTPEEAERWKALDKDFWDMQNELERRVTAARRAAVKHTIQ